MKTYETLSLALDGLQKEGYTYDFNLKEDCLHCASEDIRLDPDDFDIVGVYRFEGMTNPSDSSVLYAVESKTGLKGTLLDAYGAYSEAISPRMARKLRYTPENPN